MNFVDPKQRKAVTRKDGRAAAKNNWMRALTPEQRSAIGRKAGLASAAKLTAEQRSERGRKGGLAKKKGRATKARPIRIQATKQNSEAAPSTRKGKKEKKETLCTL
jgi:hypothetical protein